MPKKMVPQTKIQKEIRNQKCTGKKKEPGFFPTHILFPKLTNHKKTGNDKRFGHKLRFCPPGHRPSQPPAWLHARCSPTWKVKMLRCGHCKMLRCACSSAWFPCQNPIANCCFYHWECQNAQSSLRFTLSSTLRLKLFSLRTKFSAMDIMGLAGASSKISCETQ